MAGVQRRGAEGEDDLEEGLECRRRPVAVVPVVRRGLSPIIHDRCPRCRQAEETNLHMLSCGADVWDFLLMSQTRALLASASARLALPNAGIQSLIDSPTFALGDEVPAQIDIPGDLRRALHNISGHHCWPAVIGAVPTTSSCISCTGRVRLRWTCSGAHSGGTGCA